MWTFRRGWSCWISWGWGPRSLMPVTWRPAWRVMSVSHWPVRAQCLSSGSCWGGENRRGGYWRRSMRSRIQALEWKMRDMISRQWYGIWLCPDVELEKNVPVLLRTWKSNSSRWNKLNIYCTVIYFWPNLSWPSFYFPNLCVNIIIPVTVHVWFNYV